MEELKRKRVFLIDALGAVFSVICLLTIYHFQELFGMPKQILSTFASIALMLSVYSFTCYFLNQAKWRHSLFLIYFLNIGYCIYTIYEVCKNSVTITNLGFLYFILEVLIILLLATYELKLCRTGTH